MNIIALVMMIIAGIFLLPVLLRLTHSFSLKKEFYHSYDPLKSTLSAKNGI